MPVAPPRMAGWSPRQAIDYAAGMSKKKRYLTATLPDGYVKTIGPTSIAFTHYWRIVADLGGGRTEVFWGHTKSLREANGKKAACTNAARQRGWMGYAFDIVALSETDANG